MVDNDEDRLTCPKCVSKLATYFECPTYPNYRTGGMLRCYPPCGDARAYSCTNYECDWAYVDGLHPMNPRYDQNLRNKPDWIVEGNAIA